MSLDLFRVLGGLDIQLGDLSKNANILVGDGLPGGDAGVQDAAPVGTLFLRTNAEANGHQLYWKKTTTQNSFADWTTAADKAYVDAVAQGISWREPVTVLDSTAYANIAAAEAAANVADTVDGITIVAGDRLLFTNLTTGNDNVYIVSGSTGAWTFTEDTNTATDGDAVMVQSGTSSEQQWVYDGTQWIQISGATSAAELQYIRTFIGKTGPGSEMPTYSSTEVVTQATNLETAIGAIDAAFGTGEITNNTGNVALTSDMTWGAAGTLDVTEAFDAINNAIGDRTYTNDNVVTDGQSIAASINAIDTAIGTLQDQTGTFTGSNVTASGGVTVDTIPLASATEAKWIVQVRETGTPANRRSAEIHAMNDGSSLVDHTVYAVLALGSAIAGLVVDVDINGTDMRLRLTATNNIDYVVRRVAYTAF